MRWQIKEMLRSKKCTIDEAIGVAENFAATPGVNGEGKQLVAMLKGLKPWLTKVSIGSQYYTDFINRALRRSNPRLPRPDDFNIRPAQF